MGVITEIGRTQRAIDFGKRTSIWLAIGRTTAWPNEDAPPDPDQASTTVEEIIGLKLFLETSVVTKDPEGTIIFEGEAWKKLSDADAIAERAGDLYVKFEILPEDFPGQNYRQVGIFVDSIPAEGFDNFTALEEDQFQSLGALVYLSNEKVRTRYESTRHLVEFILPQ